MTEPKTLGFLGIGLLCGLYAATAEGATDLALQIARVSANEGSFVYPTTTALVWQVVRENGGDTRAEMSSFLARHSPRVHGRRPCKRGNCFWSPFLSRNGSKPMGLEMKDVFWEQKIKQRWLRTLEDADRLVSEHSSAEDPCHIPPRTWGGSMDRAGAMRKGLYPIGCRDDVDGECTRDSCNDGYTKVAECWMDTVWVCDPAFMPAVAKNSTTEVHFVVAPR